MIETPTVNFSPSRLITSRHRIQLECHHKEMRARIGPDHERIMDCLRRLLPADGNVVRDSTVPAYTWGNQLLPCPHGGPAGCRWRFGALSGFDDFAESRLGLLAGQGIPLEK